MVVGIELVGEVVVSAMGGFRGRVGAVGGGRPEDAGFASQEPIDFRDRVAHAVEKQDIVRGDGSAAALVDFRRQEFACFRDAGGVTIAPGGIVVDDFVEQFADPGLDDFALIDRIADIFPRDGLAQLFDAVGDLDDLADRIGQ